MSPMLASCVIAALATMGVILRPWRLPEAVWAVAGAGLLILSGLLSPSDAARGVARGLDVYLFLIGMMLLSELARAEGVFDWLAAHAAKLARGSPTRLFDLTYLIGTLVTVFLSNDATAVVLTPAIVSIMRKVQAARPLPWLFVPAFIANAASFVLPISNPANLVIYGSHMPPLTDWLRQFALASALSIGATWLVLRLTQGRALRQEIGTDTDPPALSAEGRIAAAGILATALLLMLASAFGADLGWPTCLAGSVATASVLLRTRSAPWRLLRGISWGVLPLVAGLFVIVEALDRTGFIRLLSGLLADAGRHSQALAAWGAGLGVAGASNLVNNLPAGLIAGTAVATARSPAPVTGAILIGVDLGPNLSVTGSLATILWLAALRREGQHVDAWSFLRLGSLVMPPALILAIGGTLLAG